jgi:GTP cyclohydrolase I
MNVALTNKPCTDDPNIYPAERADTLVSDRPSRAEAEAAVRVLLRWAGEDPMREGLVDTPKRVIDSYGEFFGGYAVDPMALLTRTFEETDGYEEMVALRGVRVESYCEHHLVPILGVAHVAYLPRKRVVGISKLARVVEVYAKRMQIQERLTVQIADTIEQALDPRGVAVFLEAQHQCMTTRGAHQTGVSMVTKCLRGAFESDVELRREFMQMTMGTNTRNTHF